MAGNSNWPFCAISFNRCTPVVVSSETPFTAAAIFVHFVGLALMDLASKARTHLNSGLEDELGSGRDPSAANFSSNSLPLWMSIVASPPSSTMRSGPLPSAQVSVFSVQSQYSSSVSPFQANTAAVPAFATAAAAWSCVEKMLQEHQRTSAPSSANVSINTAVCTVMCKEPAIFTPLNGFASPYSLRQLIRPGISCSARLSSLRPNSAKDMSRTFESAIFASSVRLRLRSGCDTTFAVVLPFALQPMQVKSCVCWSPSCDVHEVKARGRRVRVTSTLKWRVDGAGRVRVRIEKSS
mmetsp:Transcript_18936/g.47285  ORF Transcript_18936/g.47285 Transcript_18936/m.47285 type:complete len:295 (+) Transcript_18936:1719-2603(+)